MSDFVYIFFFFCIYAWGGWVSEVSRSGLHQTVWATVTLNLSSLPHSDRWWQRSPPSLAVTCRGNKNISICKQQHVVDVEGRCVTKKKKSKQQTSLHSRWLKSFRLCEGPIDDIEDCFGVISTDKAVVQQCRGRRDESGRKTDLIKSWCLMTALGKVLGQEKRTTETMEQLLQDKKRQHSTDIHTHGWETQQVIPQQIPVVCVSLCFYVRMLGCVFVYFLFLLFFWCFYVWVYFCLVC